MSYDLMVFDATAAPRDRTRFLTWYEEQMDLQESLDPHDAVNSSPALQAWYREIIETFPPMNGPLASSNPDDPKVTDYSLGPSVIYGAFAWSQAQAAYRHVKELAEKHGVGLFDANGPEAQIWWPGTGWKLSCEARGEIPLPLDLVFDEILNKLDPRKNSFLILEHNGGSRYIQCGGSKTACTVEFRAYEISDKYKHYVVGHANGSTEEAAITMSGGDIDVRKGEILTASEAAELFALFYAGNTFPAKYVLRERDI